MPPHAIVSYDGTENDHDALRLGAMLRAAGADLTLAYVRHVTHHGHDHEQLSQQAAEHLLQRGARWLDDTYLECRVVLSPSTGYGLGWLADRERGDLIVFGSDYRTPRGRVAIGRSAQTLLEGGPAALAFAPAGLAAVADPAVRTIGILRGTADEAAIETAFSLAGRLDATVVDTGQGVDVLVVGSRREAPEGRVLITSSAHNAIEQATAPVLVVARDAPLWFESLVTA